MSYSNNWGIDEVTEITSLKNCYRISKPNIKTKSILEEVGCPRLATISDNWDGKGNIDANTSIYKFDPSQSPFVSYGDLQFYAIPNFLVNDKYVSAYGLIKENNEEDESFQWKEDISYSSGNKKNKKEKWNYNYAPIVLLDSLTNYNRLKHYDINTDNDSIFAIMEYNANTKTEAPSIKIVPTNILKYVYSITEKDLHISKNTTNISTYSFVNGSLNGTSGNNYYIKYDSGSGFSERILSNSYNTIKGDLIRIEYIYTLNPKTDVGLVDKDTLRYEQRWPILNENEQNELDDKFLNSILFSDIKREIFTTGKIRTESLFQRIDFNNPSQAYRRYENNFSWNFFGSIPQGLHNMGILFDQNRYYFSSPMIWKYREGISAHAIYLNLNPTEAITTGYESNTENVHKYLLNYIIGQTVFLNIPRYEWLFSSTKSFDNDKDYFVTNGDFYFKSGYVDGQSEKAFFCNRAVVCTTTSRPQNQHVATRHSVHYRSDTGPNYIADPSETAEESSVSFPLTNSLYTYYRWGPLDRVTVFFPLKGSENHTIRTSDYVGIGELKKKIEEEIAGEKVTVKELNWFGDPYYILDAEGKDVTHDAEKGTKVNHRHGVDYYSNDERGIYISSATNSDYGLAINFDFTLSVASVNMPNRNAVVGLTTEPFWFEYNYDNCTYSIKSSIPDYQNLFPVTTLFKFYVYDGTNNYEWYTKEIKINNEAQTIDINNNNRLIVTCMPVWEDVSGQVSFEEIGSSIRIDYDDYSHAKYIKIGDEFPLPVGIKGVKNSTNFEASGINTEIGTLIYNETYEDGDYRRDWDLYAKIIDNKLVLYGRDSGDDGGQSWDDEWEDFETGLDVQKLLSYVKGTIDWEVKTTQNNTEVWKRTGFETGYVSLLLYETKAESVVKSEDAGTKIINGVTYKAEKLVSSTAMPPRVWGIHYRNYASTLETNLSLDDLQPGDDPKELPNSGLLRSTYVYIDPDTKETFLLDQSGREIDIYGWRTYKIQS